MGNPTRAKVKEWEEEGRFERDCSYECCGPQREVKDAYLRALDMRDEISTALRLTPPRKLWEIIDEAIKKFDGGGDEAQ